MQLVVLGAAAVNQTPLDWRGNAENIAEAIRLARTTGVQVLCLPELAISGYGCEDAFFSPEVAEISLSSLQSIALLTSGMAVAVGLPVLFEGSLYDGAALLVDGRIVGIVAKRFLAKEGLHYEQRWFRPWPQGRRAGLSVEGAEIPFGDYYFDLGGVTVGFEICEDAWAARRPATDLATHGIDVLLNPSASHFAFAKQEVRKRFVQEGSRMCAAAYVYANLLGNEAGRILYDGSCLIAAAGALQATGRRFSYQSVQLTATTIDIDSLRMHRARLAESADTHQSAYAVVRTEWSPAEHPCVFTTPPSTETWESSALIKEEEFTRAVTLGLFDYMRKSRSNGFVVSLSGGADSAGVAALVALMVRFALDELGVEAFCARLGYLADVQTLATTQEVAVAVFVKKLLSCVYQATQHSSERTRAAASAVAAELGATYTAVEIEPLVQEYLKLGEEVYGETLSWERHDAPLQNIQARVRGPLVWLLANLKGALLLATSNRSEAAVGYTTMDGDTCGGLSPIAGIDKAFLLRWLGILERGGLAGLAPMPSLALITSQAPTAELRPASYAQTDEQDLMPYPVLDAIERLAIRDKHSPKDVFSLLCAAEPGYPPAQLGAWVERFFVLWCRNQWKRERYAPSFHLDDENLDPKTWCRFPILSGGYQQELLELRAIVAGK